MANEFVAKNGLISQNNSIVSGSLIVTQGITGSLSGTASFATTASYALTSAGGGVTQIIAGTNITISPAGGTGAVTINSSQATTQGKMLATLNGYSNLF